MILKTQGWPLVRGGVRQQPATIDWGKPMFDCPSLPYVALLLSLLSLLYWLGGEV
jgi:hypothetical protein